MTELKCVTCFEDAEIVFDGYSFCKKHAIEHAKLKDELLKKYIR